MSTLFITGSTNVGGAEKQLLLLCNALKSHKKIAVCLIGKPGPLIDEYRNLNIPIFESKYGFLNDAITIMKAISSTRPKLVVNWLYRADILGALLARLGGVRIIYNSARNTRWPAYSVLKMRILRIIGNNVANKIIANSENAINFHISQGFKSKRFVLIPNFLDQDIRKTERDPKTKCRIGIASRAVNGKGHFELIDVIQSNKILRDAYELDFIGPGITKWKALANALNSKDLKYKLSENVLSLNSWFSSINLYAALSEAWESDSNSLLEAVISETPVICSPIQNYKELNPMPMVIKNKSELEKFLLEHASQSQIESEEVLKLRSESLRNSRNPEYLIEKWNSLLV